MARNPVKSYVLLENAHREDLPPEFEHDDVRFSESLVVLFLDEFTRPGDIVFDPFAGYGTTILVAGSMGRVPFGLEIDPRRVEYIRARTAYPKNVFEGDARRLSTYALPPFDFSITSPPYMSKYDPEDPFTAYAREGRGYAGYLEDIAAIYAQVAGLMKDEARVVIEAANLKNEGEVTTLAWDIAGAVSRVLHFDGEIVVGWDTYGYGYEHSYCLLFSKK